LDQKNADDADDTDLHRFYSVKKNPRKSVLSVSSAFYVVSQKSSIKNSHGFYLEAFEKHGIAAIVPSVNEQSIIHSIIFPKLEDGIVVPEDKEKMLEIINGLVKKHHADAVVLGCTELPLMIKDGDVDALILNTTQIHIDVIVDYILQR